MSRQLLFTWLETAGWKNHASEPTPASTTLSQLPLNTPSPLTSSPCPRFHIPHPTSSCAPCHLHIPHLTSYLYTQPPPPLKPLPLHTKTQNQGH